MSIVTRRSRAARLLLFVLGAAFVVCGCSSVRPPKPRGAFATLAQLAAAYGYSVEPSAPGAGSEIITKAGKRVVFTAGSDVALVNGAPVRLGAYCVVVRGDLMIPTSAIDIVEGRCAAPEGMAADQLGTATAAQAIKKLVIDPGHGGNYPGAKSSGGLLEKEVNLDISSRLRDILVRSGVEVIMTRSSDAHLSANYDTDLQKRIDITLARQPDVFMTIHSDASTDRSVSGFTLYVAKDSDRSLRISRLAERLEGSYANRISQAEQLYSSNRRLSYALAREIQSAFKASLGTEDRGVHEHGARVIKWAQCPAVLVEVDFLTNYSGAARLASSSFRQKVAEALAQAILQFGKSSLGPGRVAAAMK